MPEKALAEPRTSPEVDAWRELTSLLLRSAVDQAVYCNREEVQEFQRRAHEAIEALPVGAAASQVLIAAGALAQSISHYNGSTQKQVDALSTQVHALIGCFVEHLREIHHEAESAEALEKLGQLVSGPGMAAGLGEIEECLSGLRDRALAERRQARELTERLQDRVTILEQTTSMAPLTGAGGGGSGTSVDACTGLPVRAEAEGAIRRAAASDAQAYVAVFYLHRMALTNARFGEAIGNQVILFASQHLATAVTKNNDALFRWTGPAFVAVLPREESLLTVNNEVQRVISSPLSRFFETPSRSVYLPIKITGEVIPMDNRGYAEVADQIERFVLNASGNFAGD